MSVQGISSDPPGHRTEGTNPGKVAQLHKEGIVNCFEYPAMRDSLNRLGKRQGICFDPLYRCQKLSSHWVEMSLLNGHAFVLAGRFLNLQSGSIAIDCSQ